MSQSWLLLDNGKHMYSDIFKYMYMLNFNIFDLQFWPSSVTLTLSWHMGNMGAAYYFIEVNIWAKFEENPSVSIGFIEWTSMTMQSSTSSSPQNLIAHVVNRVTSELRTLWVFPTKKRLQLKLCGIALILNISNMFGHSIVNVSIPWSYNGKSLFIH